MIKHLKYGLLLLLLLIKQYAAAQGFNRDYPFNNNVNLSTALTYSTVGNEYIIAGQVVTADYRALRVLKLDSLGDTVWDKIYADSLDIYYTGRAAMVKTYDNAYVIGGSYVYDTATINIMQSVLIKINENGDTLWRKFYDGPFYDVFRSVALTKDSGFIAVGEYCINSFNTVPKLYLVKIDSAGNEQWRKVYPSANSEAGWSVQQTFDGGYIIGGWKGNSSLAHNYVVKTDSLGEIEWTKYYIDTVQSGACMVSQLQDSSYVIISSKYVNTQVGSQCQIRKTDKEGNLIWHKYYGDNNTENAYSHAIVSTEEDVLIAGQKIVNNNTPPYYGWILRIDKHGNQKWARQYSLDNYNELFDISYVNNEIIACGQIAPPQRTWVIKTDSMGCIISGCAVGIREVEEELSYYVYPNPATSILNINIRNDNTHPLQIKLLDITGKELFNELSHTTGDTHLQKDISYLTSGLYILLIQSSQKSYMQKVIIAK